MAKIRTRPQFPGGIDKFVLERSMNQKYFTYTERFIQLPGINADLASTTEATNTPVNRSLEVSGTNGTSALATFADGGGCTITTAGADEDQMIIGAHLDTKQSALAQANWRSSKQPLFAFNLVAPATITAMGIWAGFKLTSGTGVATMDALGAADANQFLFTYATTSAGAFYPSTANWCTLTSRAGTDVATDTGIPVVASTLYRFLLYLDKDRVPTFVINDEIVSTADSAAVTSLATYDFFIGVMEEGAGAARAVTCRNFMVSQLYGT